MISPRIFLTLSQIGRRLAEWADRRLDERQITQRIQEEWAPRHAKILKEEPHGKIGQRVC